MPTQGHAGVSKQKTKRRTSENGRRKLSSERVKQNLHSSGSKPKKAKKKATKTKRSEKQIEQSETTQPSGPPPQTAAKDKDTRLTIDQMLAIYPFDQVKSTVFNIDHEKFRANSVKLREKHIEEEWNVNICKEQLKWLDKFVPHRRPIDPNESEDLHPDTLWRIICLKYELRDREVLEYGEETMKNVNAVLASYRSKKLEFDRNRVTVWFDGKMIKNISLKEWAENEAEINAEMIQKRIENGGGLPWVENIDDVLWDTGSDETELFRDDKLALGNKKGAI
ncbi:hypothetical protein N7448_008058 [Penicillium atrosanguineum]|uniref:Uncharacterized protein n=1 Tax=Penicillium atrosanguineum TaxID=1132637 RepID=A0A9W9UEF3_9EURO|nr:uncharacterized protein N7443_000923 [Penicillium atrosanguineum]KAJ5127279.1 hypothetical protein N7448_008058 [Penicillium atrosanguineum]KAJ5147485.1 hypothetical protein N7526_000837 [Penicillium atrosanguineum]KAJ5314039.1 hypothetical protein N7443_000923 [Penicillium atrosanguineum]KAJ5331205.1 hypothetical protein N7476_000988 [Penicillium atrosanguineum]